MNIKNAVLSVLVLAVTATQAFSQAIIVPITDDATIQQNAPTNNYGSATGFGVYNRTNVYYKSWLKLDASSLQTLTAGNTKLTLTAANTTTGYTVEFYLLAGIDSSTWSENTITWNNAPGNNTSGFGFTTQANASLIGSFTNFSFTANTAYNLVFTGAAETSLLDALNSGSRTATIALTRPTNSTGTSANNFFSTEATTASYVPQFSADVIPEPSTYAMLVLSALGLSGYALRRRLR